MHYDDFDDEIANLLQAYNDIKKGIATRFLDEDDFIFLVEYFQEHSNMKMAIEVCETGIIYHQTSNYLYITKADLLYQVQNYRQALATLDYLEQLLGISNQSILLRCDILLEQGKSEEAEMMILAHISGAGCREQISLYHELANIYDELENYKQAYETYKKILRLDSRNEEALYTINLYAGLSGKYKDSLNFHNELIQTDVLNTIAWYNLGDLNFELKNYDDAIDALEYSIALDDKQEASNRKLAEVYMRTKKYDQAISILEDNLKIGIPEDVIYQALGVCFEKKKDYSQARKYYEKAYTFNFLEDEILYKVGYTYFREKKFSDAIEVYEKAYQLDPTNATYSFALGNCYFKLRMYEESFAYFYKTIELKKNNRKAWLYLTKSLYLMGSYEYALNQAQLACIQYENHTEFLMIQSAAAFKLGNTKNALTILEEGLSKDFKKFSVLKSLQPDILTRKEVSNLWSVYKKN